MMGMIDDFVFEMGKSGFDRLNEQLAFEWSRQERLYNHPILMKKGKSSHKLDVGGTLILQQTTALDRLTKIAEEKRPVTFVLHDHTRVMRVVITSITIDRDVLLDTGAEVRKKFKMSLERFYGN